MSAAQSHDGRIPSLDGLRAVAILMVLLAHGAYSFNGIVRLILDYIGNSTLGVQIFFVLSGYLIYSLSVREIEKTGQFNWRLFYLRRGLRILPLFYAYIGVLIVLVYFNKLYLRPIHVLSAATFSMNYRHVWDSFTGASDYFVIGHYWTLALEEQFYLAWPILMLLFLRKLQFLKVMVIIVISAPIIRTFVYLLFPDSRGQIIMMFHTGFDSIAAGVLLGELHKNQQTRGWIETFVNRRHNVVACMLFIFLVSPAIALKFGGAYSLPIGKSLELVCVCFVISASIWKRDSLLFKILNWAPLVYIGVLSYSLYVWNNLFLYSEGVWVVNVFPFNFFAVLIFAVASHFLIERPFLNLKDRFHQER